MTVDRHFLGADYVSNGLTDGQFVLTNQSKTATLTDYLGPGPPATSPPHRYVVLCYLQNTTGVTPPAGFDPTNHFNFNITSFVNSVHGNNFTLLGATFFFFSANDTTGSVAPNSTTGNTPVASGTAPPNPSGSSTPSGAIKLSAAATAVSWSIVAVLSPILLL
ncbi:hypothetical protein JB92DRAFT_2841806 [Gautieria morchelliformis]|nr:hypothetical protein JB92DRAFT_2841806 [Gautieria morchelliformis]